MTIQELLKEKYHEGITVDEIDKALAEMEFPAGQNAELERLQALLSKSNSEAASYKRQLREKMSADEIKAKEEAEKQEKLRNDYEELLRRVGISENKAKFLSLGYEDSLAEESAEALLSGNYEKLFENQKRHMDFIEKKVRADVLRDTPRPTGGSGRNLSKEDIMNIRDSAERQAAIAENIELFEGE
ncbi:MAG: hypothetical protein HPZ00_06255 [Christensenellaceae bacterium]|nr:hypothetical protein [Christensenellaceae bacterium]DAS00378.1 MAG TPA: Major head protein [Bacteriophage sp.]